MRVQCDVCEKAEADVMCCADDAALCAECDVKVHAANKLAIKHQRLPLLKNSEAPRCDICQEKTGYFFCLQDRALLCRNCDVSIHTANTLSSCHHRFLVTGIRVALEAITAQELSVGSPEGSLKSATSNISSHITNAPTKSFHAHPSKLNVKDFPGTFAKPTASNAASRLVSTSSIPSAASNLVSSSLPAATVSSTSAMMQMIPHSGLASPLDYGNCYKRSSGSEFPNEAMRGWRLDELLNSPDFTGGYILGDIPTSKADAVNPQDFDWMTDLNLFDEKVCAEAFHEVPELLSLGSLGIPQPGRLIPNAMKGKAKQDMETLSNFEDAFTVPDLGLRSLPESPAIVKRRRL